MPFFHFYPYICNIVANMARFLFIFFACLIISVSPQAQPSGCDYSLTGTVYDAEQMPLPGAVITIVAENKSDVSGMNGQFLFSGLCAGEYDFRVTFVGYEDTLLHVTIPATARLTIAMRTSRTVLREVAVQGEEIKRGLTQTADALSATQLSALHGKPLGESLKEIPGVSAIQTGPAIFKPVIHGLHSQRILILNNGIRQEGQQWGADHAPEIDPNIASRIEVVKGAEAVRYGADAIGGVIIVNPAPLHDHHEFGGEVNLDAMSNSRMGAFSGTLEGGFKTNEKWSWRTQGTVRRGGDFTAPDYNLSNTGVSELHVSGAVGHREEKRGMEFYLSSFNAETGILRTAHTGNLEDLQESIEANTPWFIQDFTYGIENPRQKVHHHLIKASAFRELPQLGKLNILYGGQLDQRREYDIRRGGRSETPAFSMNLISNVLDISLDHGKEKLSGSIGFNGTFKFNRKAFETGIRPVIPDYDHFAGGIFIIEKYRRASWLLEAGIRYDHQNLHVFTFDNNDRLLTPTFSFDYISGSAGASVNFSSSARFVSNIGISTRPPHISELYSEGLHHGKAAIEEGLMRLNNEVFTEESRIRKELSRKWISTFQFFSEKMSLEVSAYYNYISNYVYLSPTGTRLTIRGYFPVFSYAQTDASLLGGDLKLNFNSGNNLSFTTKGSYVHAQDTRKNDVLIYIPPLQFENSLTYNIQAIATLQEFFITLSAPTVLKQSRAPITVYPEDIATYTGSRVFDLAPAPDGYALLNASIGFKIPINDHHLSVILSGENLLNHSYRNYMNRLRYYADEAGRNFIVRLKYNFYSH